jgi:alpha-ketoglutaric semialdehyde dehydrogenase
MLIYPRGELLIGGISRQGAGPEFRGFDPNAESALDPAFGGATPADVERACALAEAAFAPYRLVRIEDRAVFLETIATNLEGLGNSLVARARAETGLPEARLQGELARTTGQLRMFSRVLRDGGFLDVRLDHALPHRAPPRPDIRLTHVPLGPVAVFGASNFPLAFSVAGGDTASALAAGCPVVAKAHPAHPGTSELAGRAIQHAVAACQLHEGVFSLLFEAGVEVGAALAADRRVRAVGFTGSRRGGLALMAIAQARPQPIPVFAEMSSINPVVLLPGALAQKGRSIGRAFAASVTLGSGQFCTNPGLLLAIDHPALDDFVAGVGAAFADIAPATMLSPVIHSAYCAGVEALSRNGRVESLALGRKADGLAAQPMLFSTSAADFLQDPALSEEVFGPCALLVRCADAEQLALALERLEGQLTIAVHAEEADLGLARTLMPALERLAGRILFNGFGTGVEVCDAMVHGGPFPATSDGRSTSVGSLAIGRYLRPVCYQDAPAELLPLELQESNTLDAPRRVDGLR